MKNTSRPNQYPGTCACGVKVAAGAGTLGPKVAGKWSTRCWTCVTAENVAKVRSAQWRYPVAPAAQRSGFTTYRTTEGGTVTYSDDTDAACDARRDGYIY
jgi:hypothetical protein